MKKIIYWVLIGIFAVIFLVSAFMVIRYFVNSHQYKDQLSDLQQMHTTPETRPSVSLRPPTSGGETNPTGNGTVTPRPTEPTYPTGPIVRPTGGENGDNPYGILPELYGLYELNKDLVGYIYIPGTDINNPVLQRKSDKDYYLRRDFFKNYDDHGSLYVREACDVFDPSDVVTIYGHSMFDGTMFGSLLQYKNASYFKDHPLIYFDTLYERHAYQVVCVFRTSSSPEEGFMYHLYDDFSSEAEFNEFIQTARSLAVQDAGISVSYGDKFILLSTCEDYPIQDGRFVLLAVRID